VRRDIIAQRVPHNKLNVRSVPTVLLNLKKKHYVLLDSSANPLLKRRHVPNRDSIVHLVHLIHFVLLVIIAQVLLRKKIVKRDSFVLRALLNQQGALLVQFAQRILL